MRPSKTTICCIACAFICFFASIHCQAQDYILVPADYSSIQSAIDAASSGDTLLISSGTYTENATIEIANKSITLIGCCNPEDVILSGSNAHRVLNISGGELDVVSIHNLTITGGRPGSDAHASALKVDGAQALISGVIIENNGSGTGNTVAFGSGVLTTTFENCVVRNNSVENYAGLRNATAIRCILYGNSGWNNTGVLLGCDSYNCVVYGNGGGANNPWTSSGLSGGSARNCIFWGNAKQAAYNPTLIEYCLNSNHTGAGNISGNPGFTSPENGDFSLLENSIAIDAGDPAAEYNDPDGTRNDLGALYRDQSPSIQGCMDSSACNFNEDATEDDGGCIYPPSISMAGTAVTDTVFAQLNQTLVFESATQTEADSTLLDAFSVFFNAFSAHSLPVLESGTEYRLIATGRYGFADGWTHNDAAFNYAWDVATGTKVNCNGTQDAQEDVRWLYDGATDFQRPDNDTDNNAQFCSGVDKTYYWTLPGDGNSHTVGFLDGGGYGDNSGELSFQLYELSSAAGITWPDGSTGASWSYEANAAGTFDFALSDGSCSTNMVIVVDDTGCMDATACNYDADAISDDGSCDYTCCPGPGCCDDPSQWDSALQQCNTAAPDTIVVTDTLLVPTPFCGAGTHWDPVTEMCIADAPGTVDENCTVMNLQELAEGYQVLLDHTADQDSIILALQSQNDSLSALPFCACPTSINYQGHNYETVEIDGQCWFAENLRAWNYRNGDAIPEETDGPTWASLTTGAAAAFDNDDSNYETFGLLYNWYAVSDSRGICPSGWHGATESDFQALLTAAGGSAEADVTLRSDEVAWIGSNPDSGTDALGFGLLPGGMRDGYYGHGNFQYFQFYGALWASDFGYKFFLVNGDGEAGIYPNAVSDAGKYVRCVKD